MSFSLIFIWGLAFILGGVALSKGDGRHLEATRFALNQGIAVLPRMIVALLIASFISTLIPNQLIADWVGGETGLTGIFIAALIGATVPGGPMIVFPLAVVLQSAGAGTPQLIAFVTAWSIFAVHRILLYELSFVGWRFTTLRLFVGLPVPIFTGLIADGLSGLPMF